MIDIKMDSTGEIVVGPSGDLMLVAGDDCIIQEIVFRLKTVKGDWLLGPTVGCSLESFIGKPNEISTHLEIEQTVLSEISRGGLVQGAQVTAMPVSSDEVLILVEVPSIEDPKRNILVSANLDLRKGEVFTRTGVNTN